MSPHARALRSGALLACHAGRTRAGVVITDVYPLLVTVVLVLACTNPTYLAYLRWRVARALRRAFAFAPLLVRGGDRARAMGDDDDDDDDDDARLAPEPEVEDVESVGLLAPAKHVHAYDRVADVLARWRDEIDGERFDRAPAGLRNSGNTCFAASALQCLYHTRLFTAHFATETHDAESCGAARGGTFCVTCEYQAHVRKALDADPADAFSIGKLTSSIGKVAKHFVRGRQEDSHEYIRGLLDAMHVRWLKEHAGEDAEKTLDQRTQETTMTYHVFGGYTCGEVVCGDCGHHSRNYQSMIDVPVEVSARGAPSIEASFKANFVDVETLDGNNKYKCGRCDAYVRATKGSKIHVSPNVLVVPLKRFQIGRFSKITKWVEFPVHLDLSPYMSSDAPLEGDAPPTYALYGVVVHLDFCGSAHSGHYVSFVKLNDDVTWCKCDDGRVTETDEATVLKQKAYLLFYERERVREAPRIRTAEEHERMTTLIAAAEAREARVRARRKARASATAATSRSRTAAPASAEETPLAVAAEVDQTPTTPKHVFTFIGKQTGRAEAAAAARRRRRSGIDSSDDSSDDDTGVDADADADADADDDAAEASTWPQRIVCDIEMPTVASARDVRVRMTSRELSVGTRRDRRAAAGVVSLDLATPFPVDDDASELMFDASTRVMKVVMPVLARTRARADEHAEFLTRYEAARARAAAADPAGDPSSISEGEVVEEEDEEEEDDDDASVETQIEDLDELVRGMGLSSPRTRSASRAAAADAAAADSATASDDDSAADDASRERTPPRVDVLDKRTSDGAGGSIEVVVDVPGVRRSAEARSVHWSPYDRVGAVNADP